MQAKTNTPAKGLLRTTQLTMASSSCSTIIRYDVFISFNGEDTRYSFTDHLYEALIGAGIKTFRNNDSINTTVDLNPQIETAITSSRASIIVLSKNYAHSASCLDELVLIMERRKRFYHIVIPVFYHVDPLDVKEKKNSFELVFEKPMKWGEQKVEHWKAALTEVANLNHMVLSG